MIVPVFNQEASIVENLRVIRQRIADHSDEPFELIVVSDGSIDETAQRLLESRAEHGLRVYHYDRNLGKGYAVKVGALEARGRWVGFVDADLDLDAASLVDFVWPGDDVEALRAAVLHAETLARIAHRPRIEAMLPVYAAEDASGLGGDEMSPERVEAFQRAHHLAAFYWLVRDRLADGQVAADDRLAQAADLLHQRWVDAVGYFVPPYFASDYNDLWLTEVAAALGRLVYLPQVYTEHLHPVVGKAAWDRTHQERLARHAAEQCDQTWYATAHLRAQDVKRLRAVMETPA